MRKNTPKLKQQNKVSKRVPKLVKSFVKKQRSKNTSQQVQNIATGQISMTSRPVFEQVTGGAIRVTHREYLSEVLGDASGDGIYVKYKINPGSQSTFPWLSGMAPRFEKYSFKSLKFEYCTTSSSIVPGTVALVPDFNPTDPPPSTLAEALNYTGTVQGQPWGSFETRINMSDLKAYKQYFIADDKNLLDENSQINQFDCMNLYVITHNTGEVATVGRLYVVYSIELIAPIISYPIGSRGWLGVSSISYAASNALGYGPPVGAIPNTLGNTGVQYLTRNLLTFTEPMQGVLTIFIAASNFDAADIPDRKSVV